MTGRPVIAHILHYHSPVGGAEAATLFLARHMRERGWDSVMYCLPSADSSLRTFFSDHSFPVSTHHEVAHSFYRLPYLKASWALQRDFRRNHVSVIHCSDLPSAFPVVYAAKLLRVRTLCHVRVLWDSIAPRDQLFLSFVDRFAFVSQSSADQFAYRAGAQRGDVVYDAVDIIPVPREQARRRMQQEFGFSTEDKLVGMVARVGHHKDQRTLIRAAAALLPRYPDLRFLLIGDYEAPFHRAHYQKVLGWLKEFGMEDRFLFTGHRTDVAELLAALDISVLCTLSEALGLAALESMAQKTPFIGTAVGGLAEVVRPGETGLLHPREDVEALASAIQFYLDHPEQAQRMAAQAFQYLQERFSPQAYVDRMEKLYCSVSQIQPRAQ